MRAPLTLVSMLMLVFATPLSAQQGTTTTKMLGWKVNSINFGWGIDNDRYREINLRHVMQFAKNADALDRDLSMMTEETTTATAGLALYSSVSFAPVNRTANIDHHEVHVGTGVHSDKEAMVSYKSQELDTSIVYCNLHSEVTLETSYRYNGRVGKHLRWYVGVGGNVGTTYGNKMILISGRYFGGGDHPSTQESNEIDKETYGAKKARYTRAYVPYGIHWAIGPFWEVGLDLRTGIGWQKIQGEAVDPIRRTGSFVVGAKFRFS